MIGFLEVRTTLEFEVWSSTTSPGRPTKKGMEEKTPSTVVITRQIKYSQLITSYPCRSSTRTMANYVASLVEITRKAHSRVIGAV
jgi:hypothetical protein